MAMCHSAWTVAWTPPWEKSLILIKPTRPTDSAGNVSDYLATHNGGQRWPGNQSSEQYRTILEWIRGGRLQASNQAK
jgi:hypothetical protein